MKRTYLKFPANGGHAPMLKSRAIGLHQAHYVSSAFKSDGDSEEDDEEAEKEQKALLKAIKTQVEKQLEPAATKEEMKAAIEAAVKAITGGTLKIGEGDAAKSLEEILREQGAEIKRLADLNKSGNDRPVSLKEQIRQQLEAQKDSLLDMAKNKNAARISIEIKANNSTMSTGYTTSQPNAYLPQPVFMPGIHTTPEVAVTIMDLVDMGTSESPIITWVNEKPIEGDAGWTAEGTLKSQVAWKYENETATAKKVSAWVKVTTESLKDISFLTNRIYTRLRELVMRKLQDGIINGDGTGNSPLGIIAQAPAYTTNSYDDSVAAPTTADALMAMSGQIDELEYETDSLVVVMNGVDIRKMKWEKDVNNNYIIPPFTTQNGTYVDNMRVVKNNKITKGYALVGDLKRFMVLMVDGLTLDIGLDGNDFTYNLRTILAEARLITAISDNDLGALVYDSLATVKTEIDSAV